MRVFCRVKPDKSIFDYGNLVDIPVDKNGKSLDSVSIKAKNGQNLNFTYDRVFLPETTQYDIFENIQNFI